MRIRRRYHFRAPAFVYVFVTMLLAVGAINSQNNLLFWAFGFALAVLIVSGLLSGAMLMGVRVEREPIGALEGATLGRPLMVRYRVTNRNRVVPAFALTISEIGGPLRRVARDRQATWGRLMPAPGPRAFVTHVGPRQTLVAEARVTPARRGRAVLSAVRVSASFPFGIIGKSLVFVQAQTVVVRPALVAVREDLLRRGSAPGDSGSRPLRRAGTGEEFFSLREYAPGDRAGTIAWRASARRGNLLVRLNSAPAPMRVWVVLRFGAGGAGADRDGLDETAISLAASLVRAAHERGMEVGLAVPEAGIEHQPRRSRWHEARMLDDLGALDVGAARAGRTPAGMPGAAAAHRVACIVVHAGAVDGAFAPGHVTHVSAMEPGGWQGAIGARLDTARKPLAPGANR